jgi:hypothetical protein
MKTSSLTIAELELLKGLPKPPMTTTIHTTNVWIIEWLPSEDLRTGLKLHEWMESQRKGWSTLAPCKSKREVLQSIEKATVFAKRTGISPVLHIEAHGGHCGLEGPDISSARELLGWGELTEPLQRLNIVTRCNLILVVAACTGFAAVQALARGPRAPVMALVGPDTDVMPRDLLEGTKEMYRRWQDANPTLEQITASATQQSGTFAFVIQPFTELFYEVTVEQLVVSMRPDEKIERTKRLRRMITDEGVALTPEIESRLAQLPRSLWPQEPQKVWDEMFMIDLYPENRERFSLDFNLITKLVTGEAATV